ncbi:hypothetical protein KIPB_005849, partial [Kipferlia bialata]
STAAVVAKVTSSPAGYTGTTLSLTYSAGAYRLTAPATEFTVAGSFTICLEVDGTELGLADVTFEVLPDEPYFDGTATYTHVQAEAHSACTPLTLAAYVRDQYGNGIPTADPVTVSITEGPGEYVDRGPYTLTHTTDGQYTDTTLDANDFGLAGTYTISLSVDGTPLDTASVTVGVGSVSAADSSIVLIASVHNPDSALTITATLADACSNAISSGYTVAVNIYDSASSLVASPELYYSAGVFKYSCDTTAVTVSGEYTVELSVDGTAYPSAVEAFTTGHGSAHDGANSSITCPDLGSHASSSSLTLTADIGDQFNNPVTSGVVTIDVITTVAGYTGPVSIAMTHTAGGHYTPTMDAATLGGHFTLAGDYTLTLKADGVALPTTAVTLTVVTSTAIADGSTTYSYITDLPDITAGEAVELTAYVRDVNQNEISDLGVTVSVRVSPAGYTPTPLPLSYSAGAYRLTTSTSVFTVAGTYTVCLEVEGVELPLSNITFEVLPDVPYSDGTTSYTYLEGGTHTACAPLTLSGYVRDQFGNPILDSGTVTVSITDAPCGYETTGPYSLTNTGNGQYTITTLSTLGLVGSYTISLEVESSTLDTAVVTVGVGPFAVGQSTLVEIPSPHNPDSALTLSATLADACGNPISSGYDVAVNIYDSTPTLVASTALFYSSGESGYTSVTNDVTVSGIYTMELSVDGTAYPETSVTFETAHGLAQDGAYSSLTCDSLSSHVPGSTLTLTANIADQFNNPVTSGVVSIEVTTDVSGYTGPGSLELVHTGLGHYVTVNEAAILGQFFVLTGDYTMTLLVDGIQLAHSAETLSVVPGAAVSDGTTTFSYIPSMPDITAKTVAVFTAYVRDAYENEVTDLPVTAKVSSSTEEYFDTSLVLSYVDGAFRRSTSPSDFTLAGSYDVCLEVDGVLLQKSCVQFEVLPDIPYADGTTSFTHIDDTQHTACTSVSLVVYVRDQYGNIIPDSCSVTISVTDGPAGYVDTGPYTLLYTDDDQYSYTTSTVSDFGVVGVYTVSLEVDGITLGTAIVTVTVGAMSPYESSIVPVTEVHSPDDVLSLAAAVLDGCRNTIPTGVTVALNVYASDSDLVLSLPLSYSDTLSLYTGETSALTVGGSYSMVLSLEGTEYPTTEESLTIGHGAASGAMSEIVTPGDQSTQLSGTDLDVLATVRDQFGNTVTSQTVYVRVSIDLGDYVRSQTLTMSQGEDLQQSCTLGSTILADLGEYKLTLLVENQTLTGTTTTFTVVEYTAQVTVPSLTVEEGSTTVLSGITFEHAPYDDESLTGCLSVEYGTLHSSAETTVVEGSLCLTGTSVDLSTLMDSVTYSPPLEFYGTDTLSISVLDTIHGDWDIVTSPIEVTMIPEFPTFIQYDGTLYVSKVLDISILPLVEYRDINEILEVTVSMVDGLWDEDGNPLADGTLQWIAESFADITITDDGITTCVWNGLVDDINSCLSSLVLEVDPTLTLEVDIFTTILVEATTSNGDTASTTVSVCVMHDDATAVWSGNYSRISLSLPELSLDATIGTVSCDDLLADVSWLGTDPQCYLSDVSLTRGVGSTLTVLLGSDIDTAQISSGGSLILSETIAVLPQVDSDAEYYDLIQYPGHLKTPHAVIIQEPVVVSYPQASILGGTAFPSSGSLSLSAGETETNSDVSYKWSVTIPSYNGARLNLGDEYMAQSTLLLDVAENELPLETDLVVSLTLSTSSGYSSVATKTVLIIDQTVPQVRILASSPLSVSQDAFVLVAEGTHSTLYESSWDATSIEFMWICSGDNCENLAGITDVWSTSAYLSVPAASFDEGTTHTISVRARYDVSATETFGEDSIEIVSQILDPVSCISAESRTVVSGEAVCLTSCSTHYDSLEWDIPDTLSTAAVVSDAVDTVCIDTTDVDTGEYVIGLLASRSLVDSETSYSSVTLTVTEDTGLDCSISISPETPMESAQTTLRSNCISLTGSTCSFLWEQISGPTLDLDSPDILLSTSLETPNLVLAADSMSSFFQYEFQLTCTDSDGQEGVAYQTISPSESPSSGSLTVSTHELTATETLSVTAEGWVAPLGLGPLKYTFTYQAVDSSETQPKQMASSEYWSSTELYLPIGDYNLGVIVTDDSGASVTYTDTATVSVTLEDGTDLASYSLRMAELLESAIVAANVPSALNILDALTKTVSDNDHTLSADVVALLTATVESALDDIISLPGAQQLATRILGLLSHMESAPLESLAVIVGTLAESGNVDARVVRDVVSVTERIYAGVQYNIWSEDETDTSSITAELAFSAVSTMAAEIASGLVDGQTPVEVETQHVQFSAQAVTTQSVEQEVSVPGSDASFTIPPTFGSEVGSTSDLALAMVSVAQPYMGDNSTSFYSPMTSIVVVDTLNGMEQSVTGLSSPVRIKLPLSSFPDPDECMSLNATLLVKAWDGTAWSESGITTLPYDPDLGYILADTDHFTSFVAFFHQYGIDVNTIDPEEIPDLLSSVEDNPLGLYLLGVCFSVYAGLMIVLSFDNLQNGMATFLRAQVFKPKAARNVNPMYASSNDASLPDEAVRDGDNEWEFMTARATNATDSTGNELSCVSMHSVVFTPFDVPPSPGTLSVKDVNPEELSDSYDPGLGGGGGSSSDMERPKGVPELNWADTTVLSRACHTPPDSATTNMRKTTTFRIPQPDLQELRTERFIKASAKVQHIQDGEKVNFWTTFKRKLKVNIYTGHEWSALVFNKAAKDDNMTGPRRVTNIFVFVFGIFLTSAMFFRADCEEGVARPGEEGLLVTDVVCVPYTYTQTFLIACGTTIIALPPSMLLRYAFSHTRPIGQHKDSALRKRFPPRERNWLSRAILSLSLVDLPYGYAYLWYSLSFLYLLGVGFLMLLYSMKFAKTVGRAWMVANLLGVVQDAVVNDPIKILVQTFLSLCLGSIEILPGVVNLLVDLGFV